jgi:phage baseplate assembly protein W
MSSSDDLYDDASPADYATQSGSDPRAFLGHGWAFPVGISGGRVATAEYEEDIRQAIRIILDTEPGERVMRPDFGAGLRALLFEPINTTTIALARHRVEQALILWEPRIDNIGIEVRAEPKQGILRIEVRYRVRTTNTFYNLVYPFYVQEGRTFTSTTPANVAAATQ